MRVMLVLALLACRPRERVPVVTGDGCGEEPSRTSGGGMAAVLEYMRDGANDPDSIAVTDCTAPEHVPPPGCWESVCTVRGTNAYGATVAQRWRVSVTSGVVTGAVVVE